MPPKSKKQRLLDGETFTTKESGNSMSPLIKHRQEHELSPVKLEDVQKGDIVYCKVNGRFYTHLVKGTGERGLLIGNNRGGTNGWTRQVYGKVTKVMLT